VGGRKNCKKPSNLKNKTNFHSIGLAARTTYYRKKEKGPEKILVRMSGGQAGIKKNIELRKTERDC